MCMSVGMVVSWFYLQLCYTNEPLEKNLFLWLLFLPGHASRAGWLLAPRAGVSLAEFMFRQPALLTRELAEITSKRQVITF